jgi:hypothetical protein
VEVPLHRLGGTGIAAALEDRPPVSIATVAAAVGITVEISLTVVSAEVEQQLETTVTTTIGTSDSSVSLFVLDSAVVGRLCHFFVFWKSLSKDPWILSKVGEGVKIDFISPPFQTMAGRNMKMGKIQSEICAKEVESLLEKGAIEPIVSSTEGFISGLFVIPKRSGGFRPIVNLKSLNKFVRPENLKMEGISSLQELIRHKDFLLKSI